jgi:Zn-dependent protease
MRALLDPFSLLVVSIAGWMNQHQQHWKLGKFAGIDVYLHATFILLLVWIASMHWMAGHNLETMPAGIAFMLALFGSVLLHEFGHALTAKAFGIGTRDIALLPIGGISRIEKMPEKPRQELAVALAGPAVNVVIAAVLFVFLGATNAWVPLDKLALTRGSLIERVLLANISLLFFNLLPAFPMDGGRALRVLGELWSGNANSCCCRASVCGDIWFRGAARESVTGPDCSLRLVWRLPGGGRNPDEIVICRNTSAQSHAHRFSQSSRGRYAIARCRSDSRGFAT